MSPSGFKVPEVSQYSKAQSGEWAFDSSLRGKVHIAAVSAGLTVPVSLTGDQDVRIAAVSSGVVVPVTLNQNATYGATVLTTSAAGTKSIVAAQGASTAIRVCGFSVWNKSANARGLQLRFGNSTAFWYGGLAAGAAFNWNLIGHAQQGAANKKVTLYIDGSGTAIATVYWRKV